MTAGRGDLDPRVLGHAMSAFFGGRSEARVVRVPVPVVVVDANAMYPLVNANLGTWRLLIAERIRADDVTSAVRALLSRPDLLERCFERAFWREAIGVTLVELEDVADALLPVRAPFDPSALDPSLGLEPLDYLGGLWYALPDVISAVVLGRAVPRVRRAIRLLPVGTQPGLRQVRLRGGRVIDPLGDDPFVVMAEDRARIRADASLPDSERERVQLDLKITNNAAAYGVLARFDRRELASPADVLVYGPDDEPLRRRLAVVEDPGPYTFPPVGASITAGARLMLALLELLVSDAGGTYAFVDTDAMAIIASPDGASVEGVPVLATARVREILARFADLDPYDRALIPDVWKVEHRSLDDPLLAYVISAKRYALFRRSPGGAPHVAALSESEEAGTAQRQDEAELADWSEHGLGSYLSPLIDARGRPLRDGDGRLVWIREAWEWISASAMGQRPALPSWAGTLAVTRFAVSSPEILEWFRGRDEKLPPDERMRPGSFGLIAHPDPLMRPLSGDATPTAAFESDPAKWPGLEWYDRRSGQALGLSPYDRTMGPDILAHRLRHGSIVVRTLGDVLNAYVRRPEHKSLAPDGRPATGTTRGVLVRRPVASIPTKTHLTGKEGNGLIERATGLVSAPSEYRTDYGRRIDPWTLVVPILRKISTAEATRRTRLPERTVRRAIRSAEVGRTKASTIRTLSAVAATYARERLGAVGIRAGSADDEIAVEFVRA